MKDALPEAPTEPTKAAPRITIVAQQSIPAPTPSTAVALVESIATGNLLEPARNALALDAIHASAAHASARSLKIQLHPAELGMVTATLRFAGEQLSIELQVETNDAYRHLSRDGDAIVKSLRDLGYDVDRVTVLQPALASTSAGRPDSGASMPSGQGRAPEQSGSGAAGDGNGGSGGRQPGEGGNSSRNGWHNPSAPREPQSGGLYI
jgi:chemotaxis protein MotD